MMLSGQVENFCHLFLEAISPNAVVASAVAQMTQKNPFESNNGLRVTGRSSQSISLEWPADNLFVTLVTDNSADDDPNLSNKVTCNSSAGCVEGNVGKVVNEGEFQQLQDILAETFQPKQRDGNWTDVGMKKEQSTNWISIYKGYGHHCEVDGLAPDVAFVFRMKRKNESVWGTEVVASTAPSPASTEDLNRAVEMNSEYLVSRILNLTRPLLLKKILVARDRNGMTPLMVACHIGNINIAEKLLQSGCEINAVSSGACRSPLMYACIVGHQNIVILLDHHKANWHLRDISGCNAMDYAINGSHVGILKLAYSRMGPKCVHEKHGHLGWTPLMRAAVLSDNLEILRFLINKGAYTNSVDHLNNKSVLSSAIIAKRANFVRLLLESKADPFFKNQNGKTCLEMAKILGYREITEILTDHITSKETMQQ